MSFIHFLCSNLLGKLEVITLSWYAECKECSLNPGKNKGLKIIITLFWASKPLWQEFEKTCCHSEHLLGSVAVAIPSKLWIDYASWCAWKKVLAFSRWLLGPGWGNVVSGTTVMWSSTELMVEVPSASSHPLPSTYIAAITTLALQPYKFFLLSLMSKTTRIITVFSSSEAFTRASIEQEKISERFLHLNDFIKKKKRSFPVSPSAANFSYNWFA